MTYRTSHFIKTFICMIIAGALMIYGFMVIQDKIYETSHPAVVNISAKSLRIENGTLYLPIINGNSTIYELVEETNNNFINFVNNNELHSVTHKVTFVNPKVISIVWEGNYKGTANDIDGDEDDVSYKVMDSMVIDLTTKKELTKSEIAKWIIENKYSQKKEEIPINLNRVKDKGFDAYQNAYIENGDDKYPNIVLYWRNNLNLQKYNIQKMNAEDLVKNIK